MYKHTQEPHNHLGHDMGNGQGRDRMGNLPPSPPPSGDIRPRRHSALTSAEALCGGPAAEKHISPQPMFPIDNEPNDLRHSGRGGGDGREGIRLGGGSAAENVEHVGEHRDSLSDVSNRMLNAAADGMVHAASDIARGWDSFAGRMSSGVQQARDRHAARRRAQEHATRRNELAEVGRTLLLKNLSDGGTPYDFQCAITLDIMTDPVRRASNPSLRTFATE